MQVTKDYEEAAALGAPLPPRLALIPRKTEPVRQLEQSRKEMMELREQVRRMREQQETFQVHSNKFNKIFGRAQQLIFKSDRTDTWTNILRY